MRLICPNCAAQYEVDESVIPEAGRDVQCSNCGHSWFQPGRYATEAEAEAAEAAPPEPPATEDDSDDYDLIRALSEDPEIAGLAPTASEPPPLPAAERRQPDPSVLSVLREEAERETRARREEGTSAPLETQPDLGLSGTAEGMAGAVAGSAALSALAGDRRLRAEPEEERVADVGGHDEEPEARGPRKGLLPDIEEINSTLSATSGRAGDFPDVVAAEQVRRRRGGFRLGFSLSLMVATILLLAYVLAPTLAARVPGLAGPLAGYVTAVDGVRMWIDEKMKSSTEALRASEQTGG